MFCLRELRVGPAKTELYVYWWKKNIKLLIMFWFRVRKTSGSAHRRRCQWVCADATRAANETNTPA